MQHLCSNPDLSIGNPNVAPHIHEHFYVERERGSTFYCVLRIVYVGGKKSPKGQCHNKLPAVFTFAVSEEVFLQLCGEAVAPASSPEKVETLCTSPNLLSTFIVHEVSMLL